MNRLKCLGKSSTNSQKQVSCNQDTECSGFPSEDMLNEEGDSSKTPIKKTLSVEKQVQQTAELLDKLKITDLKTAQNSVASRTGRLLQTWRQNVSPEVKPHPSQEEEEDQTRVEDEDIKTPVELKIKFLKAVQGRDFELACKLCQMILTYEPENPEASEFLPLIKKKLLEEQSSEEEEEDDDDDDDADDEDSDEDSDCKG